MRHDYIVALHTILEEQAPALFVVTGTSGVGKSAFALPLACALAKRGERVLYVHEFGFLGTVMILLDFTNANDLKVKYAIGRDTAAQMTGEQLATSPVESLGAWLDCVSGSVSHFSNAAVFKCGTGPLLDAAVFKIVEGKAPGGQWSGTGRVVVLASSNDDSYRRYAKGG